MKPGNQRPEALTSKTLEARKPKTRNSSSPAPKDRKPRYWKLMKPGNLRSEASAMEAPGVLHQAWKPPKTYLLAESRSRISIQITNLALARNKGVPDPPSTSKITSIPYRRLVGSPWNILSHHDGDGILGRIKRLKSGTIGANEVTRSHMARQKTKISKV